MLKGRPIKIKLLSLYTQRPTYMHPLTAARRQNACGNSPCPYIGYNIAPGAFGNLEERSHVAKTSALFQTRKWTKQIGQLTNK